MFHLNFQLAVRPKTRHGPRLERGGKRVPTHPISIFHPENRSPTRRMSHFEQVNRSPTRLKPISSCKNRIPTRPKTLFPPENPSPTRRNPFFRSHYFRATRLKAVVDEFLPRELRANALNPIYTLTRTKTTVQRWDAERPVVLCLISESKQVQSRIRER